MFAQNALVHITVPTVLAFALGVSALPASARTSLVDLQDAVCDSYDYNLQAPRPAFCPPRQKKVVFITQGVWQGGTLGGVQAADALCQGEAGAAGLTGNYRAWLSTASYSPANNFAKSTSPYVLSNGVAVANSWADLTDGSLRVPITLTAAGLPTNSPVWTGTTAAGQWTPNQDCGSWTNSTTGTYGQPASTSSGWSNSGIVGCSSAYKLYCFEQ